eukprot:2841236-Rhodomonas_salina.1
MEVQVTNWPPIVDAEVSTASDKYSPGPMTSAEFKFTFYDGETKLLCCDCAAPAVFADPFPITMTNFPLCTDLPALDQ